VSARQIEQHGAPDPADDQRRLERDREDRVRPDEALLRDEQRGERRAGGFDRRPPGPQDERREVQPRDRRRGDRDRERSGREDESTDADPLGATAIDGQALDQADDDERHRERRTEHRHLTGSAVESVRGLGEHRPERRPEREAERAVRGDDVPERPRIR
jgi:hypothetical protein